MRSTNLLFLVLTMLCTWTANAVQAQTYFYLGEIAVTPAAPTDQDQVQLQLIGNLSSTGSSITSATAVVNGYTINLALVTQNTIGMDVIVPHTEVVYLGQLSAGTYTVNITGFGVDDLAPADQHVFTVSGGGANACDSLQIASINWTPFSDTALVLHALNQSTTLFDYPGFVLLGDNGDTLASETVNFFGIGLESVHTLEILPGTIMPTSPFNATLHLWTGFFDEQACTWDLSVALCQPDSCSEMLVYIGNTGGALSLGSFTYIIRANGIPITSGALTLTAEQQFTQDTVCLQPGDYEVQLIPEQDPTGGQLYYGVGHPNGIQGPSASVSSTAPDEVAFTCYGPCIEEVQIIREVTDVARLVISMESGLATLIRTDGRALGELRVLDVNGRLVMALDETKDRLQFTTGNWATGLYVLQARKTDGHVLTVRFVIG